MSKARDNRRRRQAAARKMEAWRFERDRFELLEWGARELAAIARRLPDPEICFYAGLADDALRAERRKRSGESLDGARSVLLAAEDVAPWLRDMRRRPMCREAMRRVLARLA